MKSQGSKTQVPLVEHTVVMIHKWGFVHYLTDADTELGSSILGILPDTSGYTYIGHEIMARF